MKIIEIKAPMEYKALKQSLNGIYDKVITIFLAGAIDNGSPKVPDWQNKLKLDLEKELDSEVKTAVILLNPRREEWNKDWEQSKENKDFLEQVNWELDGLEFVDHIFWLVNEDSKAPISLLELGLHKDKSMTLVCPEEFYRYGNIDIVCDRYNIKLFNDYKDGLEDLKKIIEKK